MAKISFSDGEFWADKLMDLANLALVALALSQFVTEKIQWRGVVFGVILYVLLVLFSRYLRTRK